MSMKARRGGLQRLAGDGTPLVASLARGERASPLEPGLSARSLQPPPPQPARACRRAAGAELCLPPGDEWPRPGDLLHMDVSRHARFERPGHAVTGDRSPRWKRAHPQTLVGYDFAHAIVDDHSRLAYA